MSVDARCGFVCVVCGSAAIDSCDRWWVGGMDVGGGRGDAVLLFVAEK